ncbi:MAG: beta-glucuronidase [bacterium]|nr:beta-glucuronidase [bacterium]
MLYVTETETREVKELSGIWKFKVDENNEGLEKEWFKEPLKDTILMPVPSSYNDITQDPRISDHIGMVWYETESFIPKSWQNKRIFIRVGSASHTAMVFVNGNKVAEHRGGFLPFEGEITDFVRFGKENRITIMVDNTLTWDILPPGEVRCIKDEMHPEGYKVQEYFFDFFNYSGIHRPVKIYTVPQNYIRDITVRTRIQGNQGIIDYEIDYTGKGKIDVSIIDRDGNKVGEAKSGKDTIIINNAKFWEPGNPYVYSFQVKTFVDGELEDSYTLPIGIREVRVEDKRFLINGKPFYFKGFGKHEDSDIRGKGLDQVINIKDFNLLKWIGANSFRTSHYPYSEEILYLADIYGIVVIEEAPAVGMNAFMGRMKIFTEERVGSKTLEHHLKVMEELIARDKNHPCIVMWSVANEPADFEEEAGEYFRRVIERTRELDPTRPVTLVESSGYRETKTGDYVDVICVNRYYSWYTDSGDLDIIEFQLEKELRGWYERFRKPIILSEFGADSIVGFHSDPPLMFTEEYQKEMVERFVRVIDKLDFVIGEHIWNFADFATKQQVFRVLGNRKGVFTRQRQPKLVAHFLKERWNAIPDFRTK